jgi:hypothetical protein
VVAGRFSGSARHASLDVVVEVADLLTRVVAVGAVNGVEDRRE